MSVDSQYKTIVEHIFNNWYALKLAVEHSMGGPNSRQIAVDCIDYLVGYLTTENDIEEEDIEDVLEDIMEKEFNTVCEDNSVKEVSKYMHTFLVLLKQGKLSEVNELYNKLPVATNWLNVQQSAPPMAAEESSTSEEEADEAMEEAEPGWTQVRTRRKR